MKVSICCITYNHEKFIAEAIEGFLMQKFDDFEIVVSDDFSTDETRRILKTYENKYPGKIRLILNEKNIGMMPNFIQALQACTGKYIAICEGDDYWTDTLKLQKQVDFLDNNRGFSICFHRAEIVYDTDQQANKVDINESTAQVTTLDDLLPDNYIHTPTVMFRNLRQIPDWFKTAFPGDWPLHILSATQGKIYFMDEVMAAYRVHGGGVHSTKPYSAERGLSTFLNISEELRKRGFPKQAAIMKARYDINYATTYGLKNDGKVSVNRFKRSWVLLKFGNLKMKCLFFLPILLGSKAYPFWRTMANIRK